MRTWPRKRIRQRRRRYFFLFFFFFFTLHLLLLHSLVSAQFDFPNQAVACPTEPTTTGYTSLSDLNQDIQTELDNIANGTTDPPTNGYTIFICPQTLLDTSTDNFRPQLPGSLRLLCGASGSSNNNCVFQGGEENLRVRNPTERLHMNGFSFTQFTRASINFRANAPSIALFEDCVWEVSGKQDDTLTDTLMDALSHTLS